MRLRHCLLILPVLPIMAGCNAEQQDGVNGSEQTASGSDHLPDHVLSETDKAFLRYNAENPSAPPAVGQGPKLAYGPDRNEEKRLPLNRILAIAQRTISGEVIEVELEFENGKTQYEIKILTDSGQTVEIEIDAKTGKVLELEEV